MAQKVVGYIKLQIEAGKATPAPPVGPALGQHGDVRLLTGGFQKAQYRFGHGIVIGVAVPDEQKLHKSTFLRKLYVIIIT